MSSKASVSGLILLDKPAGVTSCNALFPLRKIFKTRRVGHAGSLDMRASGLIVAAVGRATRLLPFVEAGEKSYTFTAHFGYSTETDEWDGALVAEDSETAPISEEEVQKILPQFIGEIDQIPPDYSAVKLNGKRASDLKRKGREVELKARRIYIRQLECLGKADAPAEISGRIRSSYQFRCDCSKGTYIRSLVRDMAKALGTIGAVSGIRRTRIGHMLVTDAVRPEELNENSLLKPQECMHFPVVEFTDRQVEAVRNGRSISWNGEAIQIEENAPNLILAVGKDGELKAGCSFEDGKISPKFFLGIDDE